MNLIETTSAAKLMEVIAPTVHLNGSGKESLRGQLIGAIRGIQSAQEALKECAPHGRDYYVQENEITPSGKPYNRAREEWADRLNRLESVKVELFAIYENVTDQGR